MNIITITVSPTLSLQKTLLLKDFPSGSSINYYDNKFYLIGDDATHILILDSNYKQIDIIPLFDYHSKRIPKPIKADLETSTLIQIDGKQNLLVIGSASRKERKNLFIIPLLKVGSTTFFEKKEIQTFINRLDAAGLNEINMEGSAVIGDYLILSNRGNTANLINHLIITNKDFWERQQEATISVSALLLNSNDFSGISELCYAESKDILLFTASTEATSNAYDDGTIGHSYIGWVNNITHKIHQAEIACDGTINLATIHEDFKHEKIEGMCIEEVNNNEFTLHLVSDNDKGESRLFKVKMRMKD